MIFPDTEYEFLLKNLESSQEINDENYEVSRSLIRSGYLHVSCHVREGTLREHTAILKHPDSGLRRRLKETYHTKHPIIYLLPFTRMIDPTLKKIHELPSDIVTQISEFFSIGGNI